MIYSMKQNDQSKIRWKKAVALCQNTTYRTACLNHS